MVEKMPRSMSESERFIACGFKEVEARAIWAACMVVAELTTADPRVASRLSLAGKTAEELEQLYYRVALYMAEKIEKE